jgi:hypothetical protein
MVLDIYGDRQRIRREIDAIGVLKFKLNADQLPKLREFKDVWTFVKSTSAIIIIDADRNDISPSPANQARRNPVNASSVIGRFIVRRHGTGCPDRFSIKICNVGIINRADRQA